MRDSKKIRYINKGTVLQVKYNEKIIAINKNMTITLTHNKKIVCDNIKRDLSDNS